MNGIGEIELMNTPSCYASMNFTYSQKNHTDRQNNLNYNLINRFVDESELCVIALRFSRKSFIRTGGHEWLKRFTEDQGHRT